MPTRPTLFAAGMPFTVKINGRDLYDYGAMVYGSQHLNMGMVQLFNTSAPLRHSAYGFNAAFRPRQFSITGSIAPDSVADLLSNLDDLKTTIISLKGKTFNEPSPIKLEFANQTDRHFPCYYAGGNLTVTDFAGRPTSERLVKFTLPLVMLSPFAVANSKTHVAPSGTGPSFTVLDTGTAPCPVHIELEGAATTPQFIIANMSFFADFDYDLVAKDVHDNDLTGATGAGTPGDQFEPGEYGGRFNQVSTFTTSWASLYANPTESTIIFVGTAGFAATSGGDQTLLEYWVDASNGWRFRFETASDILIFEKEIGAAAADARETTQTWALDAEIAIAGSFGADGIKLYVDGLLKDTDVAVTGITGTVGTLDLGDTAEVARPTWNYDYMFIFPFQLSDDDVRRFSLNPTLVKPANTLKSKTGSLGASVRSIIDTDVGTIDNLATDLTRTNDMGDWDGNGNPQLHPTQSCFVVPAGESIGGVKVAYRKMYL